MTTVPPSAEAIHVARPHLALALDVGDLRRARELWRRLGDYFGLAKVGLELLAGEGPAAVTALVDEGATVFVDAKLHDIPNTVGRAAGRLAARGATFLTLHTAGGESMLRAGVEGFAAATELRPGATYRAGVLGVTVLTSDPVAPPELLAERAALAERCGCAGIVCAAADLRSVRPVLSPEMVTVVPGVRLPGGPSGDQARVATPAAAIRAGATLLVVGRAVTAAPDPVAAALEVIADVAAALTGGS